MASLRFSFGTIIVTENKQNNNKERRKNKMELTKSKNKDVIYFFNEIKKLEDASQHIQSYDNSESEIINDSLNDAFKHLTATDKKNALKILRNIKEYLEYETDYLRCQIIRGIESIETNEMIIVGDGEGEYNSFTC